MEDRCLYCGEIIPEGRQICPGCEDALCKVLDEQKHEQKIIATFPDYPCRRCKTTHKANCMCGYWENWFRSKWRDIQAFFKR